MSKKAWGGRFATELNEIALRFSASVDVDKRLYPQDIRGSIAHVRMLAAQGIIEKSEAETIEKGLGGVLARIEAGEFEWRDDREDVHMNVESALTEAIGPVGGKLHTARSRNDQVATDMRLYVRDAIDGTVARLDRLLGVLVLRAEGTVSVLMPGYTHLQRAQPIRLAHHLMAWIEGLERDRGRLVDARKRVNESPLGSAALAATTFPLDRERTARELGFDRPLRNSIDATADRDFLLEVLSALSIASVHLSRIAEELVLWSSQEFGFIEMSDAVTTGSSIMPQKKNPDMAELVRGKTGRVIGNLVNLLITLKGLPLAYNRDLQEDKRPVFDAFDTVDDSIDILALCLAGANFREDRMRAALAEGFLDATEIADFLAARGLPFREAHHVSGRLVNRAIREGKTLPEFTLEELREESELFDESIYHALDMEVAVERRNVYGGPARARVEAAVQEERETLEGRGLDLNALSEETGARAVVRYEEEG